MWDYAEPWALISVTSTDPVLASSPSGVAVRVNGSSLLTRLRVPGPAAARCGEMGDDQRRLIVLPPGTYDIDAVCTVCDAAGSHWWNPRTVTVGEFECTSIELGLHDCTSIAPCR